MGIFSKLFSRRKKSSKSTPNPIDINASAMHDPQPPMEARSPLSPNGQSSDPQSSEDQSPRPAFETYVTPPPTQIPHEVDPKDSRPILQPDPYKLISTYDPYSHSGSTFSKLTTHDLVSVMMMSKKIHLNIFVILMIINSGKCQRECHPVMVLAVVLAHENHMYNHQMNSLMSVNRC
ncbi:hypothetical protein DFH28DRAFT_972163 [Melampsora americana]|nr:hypothetical protein DFH28DRAFT_972163 [Melampsora americana]